ncbi:PREDICTED: uncharacterized protein LOC109130225 [Camelina sativa]|uniref:Uncharacterized protein LOC109130225 n=1 Tax=Camelina sativa TaxID=90675 RepID=A0ABM1R805_CAMSA|nr:PREDICTED: uncharacterized protein LOC109130225 [Camelina sativa]
MATVKMVLSLAPKMQWFLHQLDISNAFLNGDLDEEIYMKLPPGYAEILGITVSPNVVCKLHKSIYGLKQLVTLFAKGTSTAFVVVVVYVDDIMIASTNPKAACLLRDQLSSVFQLRDLGTPKFFLGIEIARNDDGISLTQRKYVVDLLEGAGFSDCKPSPIPMKPDVQMTATGWGRRPNSKKPLKQLSEVDTALLPDTKQYRRLIGKLQYLTITRPDISFVVGKLSQYSSAPRKFHLQAVHKILRYLKGTIGQGLFYGKDADFSVRGFTDADWGACLDSRRSVSGFAIFIGQSFVSWRSKKQQMVSMSSADSEYRAMSIATKELIWYPYVLKALRVPFTLPVYLYCDNTATIYIASNYVYHERMKHIEFACHKVREAIDNGIVKTMFVRTDNELADILTKALHPAPFQANLRNRAGQNNR